MRAINVNTKTYLFNLTVKLKCFTHFNHRLFIFLFSVLWKKIPCILHMQIWWQRYFFLYIVFYILLLFRKILQVSPSILFQSCAEGEEEEDEEGKEKTFEVPLISQKCCSALHFICELCSGMLFTGFILVQEKEMEKQKMLYQQARLHDRGAAEMVLQMISASKGRETF